MHYAASRIDVPVVHVQPVFACVPGSFLGVLQWLRRRFGVFRQHEIQIHGVPIVLDLSVCVIPSRFPFLFCFFCLSQMKKWLQHPLV